VSPSQSTTLVDLRVALDVVGRVLRENDAQHRGAWRRPRFAEHVQHAADHLAAWQSGHHAELDDLTQTQFVDAITQLGALTRDAEGRRW